MTDQEDYEKRMKHYTLLLKEKIGRYQIEPIAVSGQIFRWRVYDPEVDTYSDMEIVAPQHSDIAGNLTDDELRSKLHPDLGVAINNLRRNKK